MRFCIVYPARAHSAYRIAADNFARYAEQVDGVQSTVMTDDRYLIDAPAADVTVLIGNDAVNAIVAELYLSKKTEPLGLRYGTDAYRIRTVCAEGKRFLLLAGGRPRATIYAVYRYFELFCGCRWFWDGDRVAKTGLPAEEIDLLESPHFQYRGIRYFAHRSLHRFQAEHWSFEDWCREIDWILKKRLNLFMLRIGMDDVFQKAFPNEVPYPSNEEPLPGTGVGYNDRTTFWSLEYRGELRKKLLQYAFERDLLHPEDCGTMTHWYSRTPVEFLEKKKPALLPQANNAYADETGRVWDIRKQEHFDDYCKLTDAHVKAYGRPEIFHTIGLGERLYSADKEENQRMKLYVYHKIATAIGEKYPNAPLLIASWDLWMHFTPEEVRELVSELDPAQAILFDYTSDTVRENNFTNWGVVNRFPWVFGIFSGYEPNSEIRGYYDLINERLKLAKSDPTCCGAVLWPELSHGDPFVIEYFANNAWEGETPEVAIRVDRYAADRYPAELAEPMRKIWHDFMPIVQLSAWSIDAGSYYQTGNDVFTLIFRNAKFDPEQLGLYREKCASAAKQQQVAIALLQALSALPRTDAMTERDLYDIARTILGRYVNAAIVRVQELFLTGGDEEALAQTADVAVALLEMLTELLGSHTDYSLLDSLEALRAVAQTNPVFEHTLKENASNHYCRSYIYENARYLYLPEMKLLFGEVLAARREGRELDKERLMPACGEVRDRYFAMPLAEMARDVLPFDAVLVRAAEILGKLKLEY